MSDSALLTQHDQDKLQESIATVHDIEYTLKQRRKALAESEVALEAQWSDLRRQRELWGLGRTERDVTTKRAMMHAQEQLDALRQAAEDERIRQQQARANQADADRKERDAREARKIEEDAAWARTRESQLRDLRADTAADRDAARAAVDKAEHELRAVRDRESRVVEAERALKERLSASGKLKDDVAQLDRRRAALSEEVATLERKMQYGFDRERHALEVELRERRMKSEAKLRAAEDEAVSAAAARQRAWEEEVYTATRALRVERDDLEEGRAKLEAEKKAFDEMIIGRQAALADDVDARRAAMDKEARQRTEEVRAALETERQAVAALKAELDERTEAIAVEEKRIKTDAAKLDQRVLAEDKASHEEQHRLSTLREAVERDAAERRRAAAEEHKETARALAAELEDMRRHASEEVDAVQVRARALLERAETEDRQAKEAMAAAEMKAREAEALGERYRQAQADMDRWTAERAAQEKALSTARDKVAGEVAELRRGQDALDKRDRGLSAKEADVRQTVAELDTMRESMTRERREGEEALERKRREMLQAMEEERVRVVRAMERVGGEVT